MRLYQKIALFHNPCSGPRSKRISKEELLALFDSDSRSNILYQETNKLNSADSYFHWILNEKPDLVISAGGDGTLNPLAEACVKTDTLLAIIPFGSGNGLARYLGYSMNVVEAMKQIRNSTIVSLDTARINDSFFICSAGIGYDAFVANRFAQNTKRGFVSYIYEGLVPYFTYKPATYSISIDNKIISVKALLISIANINQYGNNAFIAPDANASDGKLALIIIRPFPLIEGLRGIYKLFNKSLHTWKYFESVNAKSICIECSPNQYCHIDGEPGISANRFEVKISESKLKVLRPVI